MSLQDIAVKRKDAFLIGIENLILGENVRSDFSDIEELAISMFNMGQLLPVRVSLSEDGKTAVIRDGERRYRAAKMVNDNWNEWKRGNPQGQKFDTLRCEAAGQLDDVTRIFQQIEANDRGRPLMPMDRAVAFKKLIEKGMSQTDIARRLGKTVQYVSDTLVLLNAPEEVQTAVRERKVSATAAAKITKTKSKEKKEAAVKRLKEGKKVKVKDVANYTPLSLSDARNVIKKARNFRDIAKSKLDEARWEGIIRGIEMGVGLRPVEF